MDITMQIRSPTQSPLGKGAKGVVSASFPLSCNSTRHCISPTLLFEMPAICVTGARTCQGLFRSLKSRTTTPVAPFSKGDF